MLTTTISDFRRDIKRYLDKVTDNFETLIINRGKDSGVVIMSLDEYNSLNAINNELSLKENESRLDAAIEKLRKGDSFNKELIDLTIIENKVRTERKLKPFTQKQLLDRAVKSIKDYQEGNFKTQEFIEKESKSW